MIHTCIHIIIGLYSVNAILELDCQMKWLVVNKLLSVSSNNLGRRSYTKHENDFRSKCVNSTASIHLCHRISLSQRCWKTGGSSKHSSAVQFTYLYYNCRWSATITKKIRRVGNVTLRSQ